MGLPLRMNNVHAPTVPSGPTSNVLAAAQGSTAPVTFTELEQRKGAIEAQMRALGSVLDSHGVGMQTPLLTQDGFPRADIDVAQIRTTRAQIIRLRNDHSDIMKSIEKYLHHHFSTVAEASPPGPTTAPESSRLVDAEPEFLAAPFARVDEVKHGSPAQKAGMKVGDEIRVFGHVDRSNNQNLKAVADCVLENEGVSHLKCQVSCNRMGIIGGLLMAVSA